MGRMATLITILGGILLLFYFGGLLDSEVQNSNVLLKLLLSPQDISVQDFVKINFTNALLALGIGGIAIGLAIAGNLDLVVLSSVSLALLTLLLSFISVFTVIFAVSPVISILLLSPIILLMVVTTFEWWRGTA